MRLGEIQVRSYGPRPRTVVLLHGGPGAPGYMAPLARALADEFGVLEPLQRRAGPVTLSVAQHVADLTAVAPSEAVIVGSSWGGMLALSYAAAHPERVRALALVGCGTYDTASREAYRRDMDARLGTEGLARIEALRGELEAATDERERERIFGAIGELSTLAQCHDALTRDFEVACSDAVGHEQTWSDVLRLQAAGVEPAAFCAIDAPVLMIHGSEDPHPGPSTYTTLHAQLPQIEYVELARCGHLPWIERYAREPFLRLLRAWLRAHVRQHD